MMFTKSIPASLTIIATLMFNLTACSYIGGYFPDKEKDYQLSSEQPPLKIPTDIVSKGITKKQPSKPAEDSETVAVMGEVVKAAPAKPGAEASATPAKTTAEPQKVEPLRVELVKFANGETRLQMNKSVAMSWRMIGKALTSKGIEITMRDQANAEFVVQYDPNASDFKDDTFLDELNFVFDGDHNQEKPYHIKSLAREKITETVILDERGKPLSDGSGLSLLKLLATTLKADVAEE